MTFNQMASILSSAEMTTSLFDTYCERNKNEYLQRFEQEYWPKLRSVCYNSYRPQVFHGFIKLFNGIASKEASEGVLRDINLGIEASAKFSCQLSHSSSPDEGFEPFIINISFCIGSETINCSFSNQGQDVEFDKKNYTATKIVLHDSVSAFGKFFGGVGKTLLPYVPTAGNSFPEFFSKHTVIVQRVSKGLPNFGSTCFVNAGLQMLAHELKGITTTKEQQQDALAVVLKEQLEQKLRRMPLKDTALENEFNRDKAIRDAVLHSKTSSQYELINKKITIKGVEIDCRAELNAYSNLRQSFYSLCNELNERTDHQEDGTERLKLINFLCCYHEFVIVTKRVNSMRLLNIARDATTTRTNFNFIRQNDAGEFIDDIYEILALSTFTRQTVLKSTIYLYDQDSHLLKKFSPEKTEPTNRLAVSCCGFEDLTLSDVIKNHFSIERLEEYNSSDSDHQDVHAQHVFTTKQMSLSHSKDTFSGNLQIQLKLYDNRLNKPKVSPSSIVFDPACFYPTEIKTVPLRANVLQKTPLSSIESTSTTNTQNVSKKNSETSTTENLLVLDKPALEDSKRTGENDLQYRDWGILSYASEVKEQFATQELNQKKMQSFFWQEAGQVILQQQFSQLNPRSVTIKMMNKDEQFYNQEFLIDSIVCHSGGSIRSGHYRLLRFESDDSLTMCDDDRVFTVSKEQGLVQFCKRNRLSGYIYSLRPVPSASVD